MLTQPLGSYLQQKAIEKGYSNNRSIYQLTNINEATISRHFTNSRKISDTDLWQYCELFKLSYEFVKQNYSQVEHFVCKKETAKIILAGLFTAGVSYVVYNFAKDTLDKNCSNRYLTT